MMCQKCLFMHKQNYGTKLIEKKLIVFVYGFFFFFTAPFIPLAFQRLFGSSYS